MAGVDLSFGGSAFPRALEVRSLLYDNGSEGTTPRFRRLDRLDAFHRCCEYDHLELDWNGRPADSLETISPSVAVPFGFTQPAMAEASVRERRPTAPTRMAPLITDRFSDLLFSDERIPDVGVEGDDEADDFIRTVFEETAFWSKMYEARGYGGSMGTALVIVQLKKGAFSYRALSPKVVQDIIWEDRDQLIPAGVLIQYVFFKEFEVLDTTTGRPSGEVREIPYVYRRIIDQEADIVFKEAPLGDDGKPPINMEVDLLASYRHKLGRFPGAWIQNLPDSDSIDGIPDCHGVYQMIDTLDRQVAQINFALLANSDPTLVLSRDPKMKKLGGEIKKGSRNALEVGLQGSASYLEIAAGGINAAREFCKEIRQAILDKTACILPGPEEAAAAQSAKAIEFRFAPMLAKAGRLRTQWGLGVRRIASVTLDLARLWSDPKEHDGNAVPRFALPHRLEEMAASDPAQPPLTIERPRLPGRGGTVSLQWGPFFPPTPADIQTETGTLAAAQTSGLIDEETAVRKAAPLFGVRDVGGMLRKIRTEKEERAAQQSAPLGALGGMDFGGADGGFPPEEPPPEDLDEAPGPPAGLGGSP